MVGFIAVSVTEPTSTNLVPTNHSTHSVAGAWTPRALLPTSPGQHGVLVPSANSPGGGGASGAGGRGISSGGRAARDRDNALAAPPPRPLHLHRTSQHCRRCPRPRRLLPVRYYYHLIYYVFISCRAGSFEGGGAGGSFNGLFLRSSALSPLASPRAHPPSST